jgi:hypothetical protein
MMLLTQTNFSCSACESICGLLTAATGAFSDGSGLSGYSGDATCEWIIAPWQASTITLTFTELSVEYSFDYVRVWQCTDIACSDKVQLAELSGIYPGSSQVVTSTTGFMKVVFTSDQNVNHDGFTASWTSVGSCFLFPNYIYTYIHTYIHTYTTALFLSDLKTSFFV